jgi:hypothetical protein
MKNYPLTSIKVSDETFKKLQQAVKLSGKDTAEVRRLCLKLGLDAFARMDFDIESYASSCLATSPAPQEAPAPLKSLPDSANKRSPKRA